MPLISSHLSMDKHTELQQTERAFSLKKSFQTVFYTKSTVTYRVQEKLVQFLWHKKISVDRSIAPWYKWLQLWAQLFCGVGGKLQPFGIFFPVGMCETGSRLGIGATSLKRGIHHFNNYSLKQWHAYGWALDTQRNHLATVFNKRKHGCTYSVLLHFIVNHSTFFHPYGTDMVKWTVLHGPIKLVNAFDFHSLFLWFLQVALGVLCTLVSQLSLYMLQAVFLWSYSILVYHRNNCAEVLFNFTVVVPHWHWWF